jgi:outer membrane protein assembly factor BamE
MRFLKKLVLLLPLVLLACAYRPDIKQGNFITDDMIARLKPGMTQTQVEYVMGPAMIRDPFHPDRWDYMFYDNLEDGQVLKKHVVVMFKDGKVVSVEKVPTSSQGG